MNTPNTQTPETVMTDAAPSAMQLLTDALKADPEYAWAWHCNLAMPVMDVYAPTFGAATVMGWVPHSKQHQLANEAAAHLMQHLFGIDITQHPYWEGRAK